MPSFPQICIRVDNESEKQRQRAKRDAQLATVSSADASAPPLKKQRVSDPNIIENGDTSALRKPDIESSCAGLLALRFAASSNTPEADKQFVPRKKKARKSGSHKGPAKTVRRSSSGDVREYYRRLQAFFGAATGPSAMYQAAVYISQQLPQFVITEPVQVALENRRSTSNETNATRLRLNAKHYRHRQNVCLRQYRKWFESEGLSTSAQLMARVLKLCEDLRDEEGHVTTMLGRKFTGTERSAAHHAQPAAANNAISNNYNSTNATTNDDEPEVKIEDIAEAAAVSPRLLEGMESTPEQVDIEADSDDASTEQSSGEDSDADRTSTENSPAVKTEVETRVGVK